MNDSARPKKSRGLLALSPLAVFLCLYLGTSLAAGDFYKVPIAVAFLAASVYSVLISRGEPLAERIRHFTQGASHHNLMLMIWIFVLAGAFARSAEATGAIDATVGLTLRILPGNLLLGGLFLAGCFISLAVGTSVGTIVALTPVALGIAQRTGLETPMIVAVIVGGSFFGDNLSFISDTTIAATRTQECSMRDKFRVNGLIAVPAAAAVLGLYLLSGAEMPAAAQRQSVEWIPIVPYLAVLVLAVCGVHVTTVLVTGIVLTGAVGLLGGSVGWIEWIGALGEGIAGMGELIVITLLAGGMLEMIRRGGGIDYLIGALTRKVFGQTDGRAEHRRAREHGQPVHGQQHDRDHHHRSDRPANSGPLRSGPAQERQPARLVLVLRAGTDPVRGATDDCGRAGVRLPARDHRLPLLPDGFGHLLAAGHSAALSEKVFMRIARPYSRPTAIVPHAARHTRPGEAAT